MPRTLEPIVTAAASRGGHVIIHDNGLMGYGSGGLYPGPIRMATARDGRRTDTYGPSFIPTTYGPPIHDFDFDLGSLAWLAGGDGQHPLWRNWVERFLWDFQTLPASRALPPRWAETERRSSLGPLPTRRKRDILSEPTVPPKPTRTTYLPPTVMVSSDSAVNVRLLSRWIRIGEYPDRLQPNLVYEIVKKWGDYEAPPDKANITRSLQAFLRTTDPERASQEADLSLAEDIDDLSVLGKAERTYKAAARQRRYRRSRRNQ